MKVFCGGMTPLSLNRFSVFFIDETKRIEEFSTTVNQSYLENDPVLLTHLAAIKKDTEFIGISSKEHANAIECISQVLLDKGGLRPRPTLHQTHDRPRFGDVYVFSSNLEGQPSTKESSLACQRHGAIAGVPQGYQGTYPFHSYAIATKDAKRNSLTENVLRNNVQDFLDFVRQHKEKRFFIERIGTGLGSYKDAEIAPMFVDLDLSRCSIHSAWCKYLYPSTRFFAGFCPIDTPTPIVRLLHRTTYRLSQLGLVGRSTPAARNSAFEIAAINAKEKSEIYLPWPTYANHPYPTLSEPSEQAVQIASLVHPQLLPNNTHRFQGTYCHLVLGKDLKCPADFVLCWTPDGAQTEHEADTKTAEGFAIALAHRWNIPVFNLGKNADKAVKDLFSYAQNYVLQGR